MPTLDQKREFCSLANQLSPENLHCDGEISNAEAGRRKRALDARWRALEEECGESVSEYDTHDWYEEIRRADLRARETEMASQPKHALLTQANPDVWTRKGVSGSSAYYVWGPSKTRGGYDVYSEFGRFLNKRELIGNAPDLNTAVAIGEALLTTVTFASMKAAAPLYRDENIQRELTRLPSEYLANAAS